MMKWWDNLKNWFAGKIYDSVLESVGRFLDRINFELLFLILSILLLIASGVLYQVDNARGNNSAYFQYINNKDAELESSLIVTDNIQEQSFEMDVSDDESNNDGIKFGIYNTIGIICTVIGVPLLFGSVVLHIEKTNNKKTTLIDRRRLKSSLARQANDLYIIVRRYEREAEHRKNNPLDPTSSEDQVINHYHEISSHIQSCYKDICTYLCNAFYLHIKEINPDDSVHVSIKFLLKDMSQVSRVVSLAHCSLGKPKDKESALDEVLENWKDLEDSSYPLKEDYALKRVSGDKDNYRVFNCGDIEKFIKTQDDADKYGKYRKPSHINRTYNATLVCPICYLQDSRIILNGFICADTTSSYSEWDKHNSYEEELISFASSTISSLVHNNIREYEKTLNAIDKIKKL